MKTYTTSIAAAVIALAAALPAFAGTQVVAGNGVSLTESPRPSSTATPAATTGSRSSSPASRRRRGGRH